MHPRLLLVLQFLIPVAILLFIAIGMVTGYLQKWLWMCAQSAANASQLPDSLFYQGKYREFAHRRRHFTAAEV